MSIPAISVLMPVYNTEKYLAEAIESILGQTFKDFELIIIDDGSTDNSLSIIEKYAKIDSRIKFISRDNKGLISTLNQGIELSQGKYIARMDADDISLPNRFDIQYEFLESRPEYVVVGSRIMLIDSDNDSLCAMGELFSHEDIDFSHIHNLTSGAVIVHPTAMIRRDSLVAIGGYRERYKHAEDIDVWLRLGEVGKLCNLNKILLRYRQHFDSIGYMHRQSQLKAIEYAIADACLRRGVEKKIAQVHLSAEYVARSKAEVYTKWGWWSLKGGNVASARKYAKKAVLANPQRWQTWKLLACSIRGY